MNQPDLQNCIEEKIKTVYRIAFHYFGNVEEAEDVTQEVFLKFYSSDIGEKNEEEIKAWLIRVTMNTCHSHYRNPFNRKRSDVSESEMENISVIGSSEQEYVERRVVMDAVLALPERYRAVVYLYYDEIIVQSFNGVIFEHNGTIYDLFRFDEDLTEDDWFAMAEEMIK